MRPFPFQECVAKDRLEAIAEAINGLKTIDRWSGLNPTERAALSHLETLYHRATHWQWATITDQIIRNPLAVAWRSIERATACAH